MSNTALLGSYGGQGNSSLMFRNHLINGCFRVWQRGTSQTGSGYGSDDRWNNQNVASTKTHSQQTFTLGQTDVPGNPQFFSRTVVSSVAGVNNYVLKAQRIESVRTLAGQTATLSFWAKADATKNIAVEFLQYFGTGGSPSADITGIGVTTIALTTSWKYYTITIAIPSISGKTIGTNNDDFLSLSFWFDAGSTYNSRTNSLGQQSGTFDIAMVQLEAETATPFERRPIGVELQMCQRYCYRLNFTGATTTNLLCIGTSTSGGRGQIRLLFPVTMRGNPIYTSVPGAPGFLPANDTVFSAFTSTSTTVTSINGASITMIGAGSGFLNGVAAVLETNTTNYMQFDAEL